MDLQDFARRIAPFSTYEDFLESYLSEVDKDYLEDIELAYALVGHGLIGRDRDGSSKELYDKVKKLVAEKKRVAISLKQTRVCLSAGYTYTDPMLKMLQQREEANRTGKLSTIFYIRCHNDRGHEVSGYVDYAHRLCHQDFQPIFEGQTKFMPRRSDLSYFNWASMTVFGEDSRNYKVITDSPSGMVFKNKRDSKIIDVHGDPENPGDKTTKTILTDVGNYISIVIYDHSIVTR